MAKTALLRQNVPKCELYKHNGELFISKMAAVTKNRNYIKWSKLLYLKP